MDLIRPLLSQLLSAAVIARRALKRPASCAMQSVEDSRGRLGVPAIDLIQFYW